MILGSFFVSAFFTLSTPAFAGYSPEFDYNVAVPDFLEAITDATASVKDATELQAIAEWHDDAEVRLPEFLNDLLVIAQQLEADSSEANVVAKYQAFADKWNTLAATYPGLAELGPVLNPILDELVAGLPQIQKISANNPVDNLAVFYQQMHQKDPWNLGLFWQIIFPESFSKNTNSTELFSEQTTGGVKKVNVLNRSINVFLNDESVYSETVEDDQVIDKVILLREATILHDTLDEMIAANEDPNNIEIVEELVSLMDTHLKVALDNGVIDDCSYSFVYRRQLGGTKETCIDINGEERSFIGMAKFDPFDHVNQVKFDQYHDPATVSIEPYYQFLGSPAPFPLTPTAQISSDPLVSASLSGPATAFTAPVPPAPVPPVAVNPWVVGGVLLPAGLWSAGFIRLF